VRSAPASVRLVEGEARRFGEIDLIARLGHGGMAEVFLAAPRARPAELVVLKRLKEDLDDSEHRAMFAEEARIMPLLQHPNIVRTTEVGEQLGRQYLALEFLDGLPLDQCSDSVSGLGERAALHVVGELLEGLHYAHELRDADGGALELVHRDVSPHNVFITYEGRVTLVDFGIARRRGRTQHTATGVVRGKLAYMAPEQALCDTLDRRADVFSAGVILWELLTGRKFWEGQSDVQILKRMTFGDLPKLRDAIPDVRSELEDVLARALTAKPEERYETARAFREAISAVAEGPMRRLDLGHAVADKAKAYRGAVRELVERHVESARGTGGLPGISLTPLEPERVDRAPPASVRDADSRAAPAPAVAPPEEAPLAERSRVLSPGDKPTTETSGATIIELPPPPARRKGFPWVAASLGGVALAGAAAFIATTGPQRAASPRGAASADVSSMPVASEVAESVAVRLRVEPASAVVHLDGMRVATLPLEARFPRDQVGHKLTVAAEGYEGASQILVFDRDHELIVKLSPIGSSASPLASATASAAGSVPRAKTTRPVPSGTTTTQASAKSSTGFIDSDPWKRDGKKKKP
jgi:hypothetical protein